MKNQGLRFFDPKTSFSTYFLPQNLENTLAIMINLSMASKTLLKTKINPKPKIFSSSDLFFHELQW